MRPVVTANVWNRCQNNCSYCVSWAPQQKKDPHYDGRNFGEVLDVKTLIKWIKKYRPGAGVHISGGEPLFYPGIEDWTKELLKENFDVTILTNGQAIKKRTKLLGKGIRWIATYHKQSGIDAVTYSEMIRPLASENSKLRVILEWIDGDIRDMPRMKEIFKDFDVFWQWVDNAMKSAKYNNLSKPGEENTKEIASKILTLVENNGMVYPCNSKVKGPIGNIYEGTCDQELASKLDPRAAECARGLWCGAFNTAWEEESRCV
jgi:organic radical activating enzyme